VRVYRISQVCNPRAPVRHRSPTRSQPVRGHRHSRTSVYRWSKIGRVARPHQYACKTRGGRNPKVRQTACPVAPSLSATLADRVPARASTADPVHRWSKIGRVARPHQYACNDRGGPKSLGPVNALPRRAIALRHFPGPCAGSRKHRRPGLSMVENRSRRAPTPIRVQRPRGPKS
jgi:hypothetical protein